MIPRRTAGPAARPFSSRSHAALSAASMSAVLIRPVLKLDRDTGDMVIPMLKPQEEEGIYNI